MDGNTSDHSLPTSDHTGATWIQCWDKDIRSVSRLNLDSNNELNGLVEDKEIAARAVALVVNSSRKGIVPLCADVANLLRAKKSLEKDILLLKQQNNALHSSSASMQTSHSTSPTPTSLNSYQDGPTNHDHNSNCQERSRPCSRCSQSSSTMSNSPKTDKFCGNKLSGYSFHSHNSHSGGGGGGCSSNSSSQVGGKLSGGSSSPPSPTILSKCLIPQPSSSAESSPTSQHHGIITQAIVHHPPDSPTPPPLDILRESPNSICDGPLDIGSLADSSSSDRLHEKPTSYPGYKEDHFLPEMVSKPISAVPKSNATVSKEIQCILSLEGLEETMKLNMRLAENLATALKEIDLLKGRLKEIEMNQLARQSTEYHSFIVTQMSAGSQPLSPHMSLNCPATSSPSSVSALPPSPQPSPVPDFNNDQSEMLVIKGRVKEQVKLFAQQATSQASSSHSVSPQDGQNNSTPPPLANGSRKVCPAVAKKPVRNPFACPLPLCRCDSCEEASVGKLIPTDQQNRFYPVNPNFYVRLNDHIVVRGDRTGYIRYIGHLNKIGSPNTVFIGLELDAPVGVNNGCFDGKQYFECPKEHGLFVTFNDVICLVKKPLKQHMANNLKYKKSELNEDCKPNEDCNSKSSFKLVPTRKPVLLNTTVSDDETLEPASMTDSASSDQISSTDSQSTSPDPIVWKNYYHNTHDQLCHRQAILRKSVHL